MGPVLNWKLPIEWDDGTACELTKSQLDMVHGDVPQNGYLVVSEHEPRGWTRRTMPKLGRLNPVMVQPDGTLDFARSPGAPFVRNIEMPLLRFADGTVPARVAIVDDATRLVLQHETGRSYSYSWPRLIPKTGSPKLVEITAAMVEAEEKAEVEQAVMEENPFFGMF